MWCEFQKNKKKRDYSIIFLTNILIFVILIADFEQSCYVQHVYQTFHY